MIKLLMRFFLLCIVGTILTGGLVYYISAALDAKNEEGNFQIASQGLFTSVDEFLAPYPFNQWQEILDKNQQNTPLKVTLIPIDKLNLNKKQIDKIKHGESVFMVNKGDPYDPLGIYHITSNTKYAYKYIFYPNAVYWAKSIFRWPIKQIFSKLETLPESEWPTYLKKKSDQLGFPINAIKIADAKMDQAQIDRLKRGEWVVDFPSKDPDSLQMFYVPFKTGDKAIQFGPIIMPLVGTYEKPIVFIASLLFLEFIVFILAILFARTLEKLKLLTDDYGQSRFDSKITISKTSSLFPLFSNLQTMGKRIKNLIESHKDLTNSISHELRTPISRLRFSLELMRDAKDKQEIINRIQSMEGDIAELEDLVSEILTYSQLDRVGTNYDIQRIELNKLIDTVLDKLNKTIPSTKKIINNISDIHPIFVDGNERFILRALQNIIQNAIKHAKTTIKLSVNKINAHQSELIIEDDGPGIPEEDREKIFYPFVQLSNQPTNATIGFGLGLAITKKIINQHQWKIFVADSDLGGAKMIVQLLH